VTQIASTAGRYDALLQTLNAAETRQAQAGQQVASGKIGSDLSAYAPRADTLVATQAVKARTDAYVASNQAVADRLTVQAQALGEVSSATAGAKQAVLSALAGGDASTLLTSLQSSLGQAAGALNAQVDGRYLFGGGDNAGPPAAAQSLGDLTAAPSVAAVFKNGAVAKVDRLDDQTTLQTGVTAAAAGTPLFQALQAVQAYAAGPNGPLNGKLTSAQSSFLQGVVQQLGAASASSIGLEAQTGALQNQVSASQTALTACQTALTGVLGDLTDVDEADAATRLQQAQNAVQASAQVFAALKTSSLLTTLSTTA